jgi:hypothetical protein
MPKDWPPSGFPPQTFDDPGDLKQLKAIHRQHGRQCSWCFGEITSKYDVIPGTSTHNCASGRYSEMKRLADKIIAQRSPLDVMTCTLPVDPIMLEYAKLFDLGPNPTDSSMQFGIQVDSEQARKTAKNIVRGPAAQGGCSAATGVRLPHN